MDSMVDLMLTQWRDVSPSWPEDDANALDLMLETHMPHFVAKDMSQSCRVGAFAQTIAHQPHPISRDRWIDAVFCLDVQLDADRSDRFGGSGSFFHDLWLCVPTFWVGLERRLVEEGGWNCIVEEFMLPCVHRNCHGKCVDVCGGWTIMNLNLAAVKAHKT